MKPSVFLTICAALTVAALALAGGPPVPPPDDVLQAQDLHRNRKLIEALILNGLSLAAEDDPLKRADTCNELAARFAGEIQQAATERDNGRAVELGDHLYSLLRQGVAGNLRTARRLIPLSSTDEWKIHQVGNRVSIITAPLEGLLQETSSTEAGELRRVLQKIRDARVEVEKTRQKPG